MRMTNPARLLPALALPCPYCNEPPVLVDGAEVYHGRSYGKIWLCRPCQAWVGVHKGTDQPLGRLANKELREWKIKAHAAFDPRWKGKSDRREAYGWLAEQLGIEREKAHIGMFDVETCKRVVELCSKESASC